MGLAVLLIAAAVTGSRLNTPDYLTIESGPTIADAMVVPGGAIDRADRAAQLFQANEAPRIIISGTGDWMANRRYLLQHRVPGRCITVEPDSSTTRDNARFSVPILRRMGAKRVIIVTTWYHSRRALACFRHEAPDIEFISRPSYFWYPGKDKNSHYLDVTRGLEVVKLFWYAVRYRIWAF